MGSSIQAMILTSPPHSLQVSMYPRAPSLDAAHQFTLSMSKTRFNLCAQVIEARFSAAVWSCASSGILTFFSLPRFAGVTSTRCLLFGAKTPWKRVRLTLGLGIREISLEMAPPAHPCAHGIPYILHIKSSGSNMTCVVPLRQGVFSS